VFTGTLPADGVCGEPVTVDLSSTVDGHVFRGFTGITPGLTRAFHTGFAQNRSGWGANPDGQDSAVKNGWSYGTPVNYHSRGGWIFQPSGCHEASKCWFTGLGAGHAGMQDSSLEKGESRLYSAPIDLSKTYQPVLHMALWFQAIDYSNPMLGGQDAAGVDMKIDGSTDGGKTWVTLDTVGDSLPSWQERMVALDGLANSKGMLVLRFTASNPGALISLEAGVDDVTITTLTATCDPQAGTAMVPPPKSSGGCSMGGNESAAGAAAGFVLLLCLAALRRRRRA